MGVCRVQVVLDEGVQTQSRGRDIYSQPWPVLEKSCGIVWGEAWWIEWMPIRARTAKGSLVVGGHGLDCQDRTWAEVHLPAPSFLMATGSLLEAPSH